MKKVMTVEGMMCGHCQKRVLKAIKGVEGVEEAEVNLESRTAEIVCSESTSDSSLKEAVESAGFKAEIIK